ncbi:hypothetical protein [Zooshikella ganghwensis]|uniref:hypothetical protein n=1 Tax=Zooshikella ganghwensis TaxID=202772 RepID=UPI001058DC73|nr:hypothetical protein [Zooshikella ganghwensis]
MGNALVFFSLSAQVQKHSVCGCPFCEVWYEQCSDVIKFVETLGSFSSPELLTALNQLTNAFDDLSDEECECGSFDIFFLSGWEKIRTLSKAALEKLEWDLFLEWDLLDQKKNN